MHKFKNELGNVNRQLAPFVKQKQRQCYDYMVKIIIVGDSGVGKTNIISRFCSKESEQSEFKDYHVATIGVDFNTKFIKVQDKIIKMQIWDTAGQQRFKTITETYYKGAAGVILVYSVDSQQSFQSIERWIEQVKVRSAENVRKILVANKTDIEQENQGNEFCMQQARKISTVRGKALADKYQMDYYETSARTNEGIREMFEDLALQMKATIQRLKLVKNQVEDVSISLSLDSKFVRSYKKVVKDGIQYKVQDQKSIFQKIKTKCSC